MPQWNPEPIWKDREVFIVGGGTSLKNFEWSRLIPYCVIGCNSAYLLSPKVINVVAFGDNKFWNNFQNDLICLPMPVFTNLPKLQKTKEPNIWVMRRKTKGFGTDSLGWNGNTGCLALNLALIFGARRINLLGYDMKLGNGKANWHNNKQIDKPRAANYKRFINGFKSCIKDIHKNWPNVEIYNITKDSDLDLFPKIDADKFWEERGKLNAN
jgi:hypothetical protein